MTTEVKSYIHVYNIRGTHIYQSEADNGAVKVEFQCTVNVVNNQDQTADETDDAIVCLEVDSDLSLVDFIDELTNGLTHMLHNCANHS